ncbi:MAG: HAMP domain-containing histidine kinase [Gammaproteobacteria bacterium]|uniref:histidine kinase n=1 Tax=Marinobacter litoralis TaxID=187981 RepID=A0A3M2RLG4_9GAMM|nr:HAMP domain-containing sensor histidine kinase [Marinobacter litoralis]MBR9870054.1 HAMP domain-containing histidine kinase [Gammaproteobacteria bacterium]RMJ06108.1 Signal transduction histidine-protein kinase ArlS [Marinobacter litoralis]
MKPSLTARLTRTLFFLIVVTTATSMFVVEMFVEDVEETILSSELKADAQYFTEQLGKGSFQPVKTGRLEATFLAQGEGEAVLPQYFQNRPLPFSEEIEVGDTTLLIIGEPIEEPSGTLFLAQDISIMEGRMGMVQLVLLGVAGFMLIVSFFVARAGAQYLVRPFKKLTLDVSNTVPSRSLSMGQIATDYRDREFCDIANAFNRFLSEIEAHIEREKSFVKLASHELRTPLSVMSGALNVLDQRQSLSAADQKTLARIRRAMQTMRDDTDVLLELARSEVTESDVKTIDVLGFAQNAVEELEHGHPDDAGRVELYKDVAGLEVIAQPALVRMLLRNLLQNALRHTHGKVEVRLTRSSLSVRDFGSGLPAHIAEELKAQDNASQKATSAGQFSNTTFGLLIVRLVCEKLGWRLEIPQSDSQGTEFVIHVSNLPGAN